MKSECESKLNNRFYCIISKNMVEIPYPAADKLKAELGSVFKAFEPARRVTYSFGYYYFSSSKFQRVRKIDHPGTIFHDQVHDVILPTHITDFKKLDAKTKEEILRIGTKEYKIHLMPKKNFLIPVLNILFQFLKTNENLHEYIYTIKIAETPGVVTEDLQNMPDIVVYTA